VGTSATYTETVTNDGYQPDSYALTTTGAWTATTYDSTCTTAMSTTPTMQPGASVDVCVKVAVPAAAPNDSRNDATVKATSTADAGVSASATLTTIAVAVDTLLVDNDTNDPVDSAPYYQAALSANGVSFSTWDLADDPALPQTYLTAHKTVVWETGNSYPGPISPYESELKALSTVAAGCSCPVRTSSTRQPGQRHSSMTTSTSTGTARTPRTTRRRRMSLG